MLAPTTLHATHPLKIAGYCILGAAATYGIAQLSAAALCSHAEHTYAQARHALATCAYDDELCAKKLTAIVLYQHGTSHAASLSEYRNYPFLWYHATLNWHINALTLAYYISVGTQKAMIIDALLNDLKHIRHRIITNYQFIEERRRWEERYEIVHIHYRDL
jgi:hypothetical protein